MYHEVTPEMLRLLCLVTVARLDSASAAVNCVGNRRECLRDTDCSICDSSDAICTEKESGESVKYCNCFLSGTPITVDGGVAVPIERLRPGVDTVHGHAIAAVSSSPADPHMVRVERGSLGDGLPTAPFVVSQGHLLLVRGVARRARDVGALWASPAGSRMWHVQLTNGTWGTMDVLGVAAETQLPSGHARTLTPWNTVTRTATGLNVAPTWLDQVWFQWLAPFVPRRLPEVAGQRLDLLLEAALDHPLWLAPLPALLYAYTALGTGEDQCRGVPTTA